MRSPRSHTSDPRQHGTRGFRQGPFEAAAKKDKAAAQQSAKQSITRRGRFGASINTYLMHDALPPNPANCSQHHLCQQRETATVTKTNRHIDRRLQ